MTLHYWCITATLLAISAVQAAAPKLLIAPAPDGEPASPDWSVEVEGKPVFLYTVGTLNGGPASFGSFDFEGKVSVTVRSTRPVRSAKILPASFGLTPTIDGNALTFQITSPRNLTIEVNDTIERALHLFANPLEVDPPKPDDPNVLYFGPGVHDLGPTALKSGQTVYLAPGAIVRPTIPPDEKPTNEKDWSGVKNWKNLFEIHNAKNITIRGRGILDMSRLPWHARTTFVFASCDHVLVEGITILDAPAWVVAIFSSNNVTVRNIKEICRRENSDGIDICNTQNVLVEDCFLRNNDDEVCVKTTSPAPAQESGHIVVQRCVVWNERARGLGITSETRRNISDVLFRDCDIIHDLSGGGDCASLAVLVSDSGTMSNIRFEDIRVEQCRHTLMNLWVGSDFWGHDPERGRVNGVTFKNISYTGPGIPESHVSGCDAQHLIENVTFDHLTLGGKLVHTLAAGHITRNAFTRSIRVISDEKPPAPAPAVDSIQAAPGDPAVNLTWTRVAGPESGIDHYNIYRAGGGSAATPEGETKVGESAGTRFTDTDVAEETAYSYRISAVSGSDLEGPQSAPVRVTTLTDTRAPEVIALDADAETLVRIKFSEPVDVSIASKPGNYVIDKDTPVMAVVLDPDGRSALLTTARLISDRPYTLQVRELRDRAKRPNVMAAPMTLNLVYHSGLVGYWRLDDGKGLVAADSSRNKLDGTLKNLDPQTCWAPDHAGIVFDGETTFVELPDAPALRPVQENDYTLAARFKPESLPAGTGDAYNAVYGIILKRGFHEGLTYDKDGKFVFTHWLAGDQGTGITTLRSFPPGHSYFVTGVIDRTHGEVRLYVDGKIQDRRAFPAGAAPRPFGNDRWRIGTGNDDTHARYGWPAKGIIGDVRIYSRALGDAEVASLAAGSE